MSCEESIEQALDSGVALLKYVSANDVGITGAHQSGFYLPKSAWQIYSPHPPEKGRNFKHCVDIEWPDGRVTHSVVTWYGKKTRSEFRLTRFGRDFPYLRSDMVGSMLVLVPRSPTDFIAYVIDHENDMEEVQAALGVEITDTWAVFRHGQQYDLEDEDECIAKKFRDYAAGLTQFPTGAALAEHTRKSLDECIENFADRSCDDKLMRCVDAEYALFKLVEARLCGSVIRRSFASLDDLIGTAQTILQRRKARAGRSLESHVDQSLKEAGIPFDWQPNDVDGRPDFVIPGAAQYHDSSWPPDRLFILAVKRTCKDRWRQVLNEGTRVNTKHLLTIQPGVSEEQIDQMSKARVKLIVPEELHHKYPPARSDRLLSVARFVDQVRYKLWPRDG